MQYLYHKDAGHASLILGGDDHRYLFKVRRHRKGERIALRNLRDDDLYVYHIDVLDKREAHLLLEHHEPLVIQAKHPLHLGWCLIEPKSIEKILPTLNELGVERISFITCQRSQKSFKLDFNRLEKILLNSSQQSGRSRLMQLEMVESLEAFLRHYPNAVMLNFSPTPLVGNEAIDTVVVGCEGGFAAEEIALMEPAQIRGLDTPLILKSESAVCVVASKLLC